ncbi:hypothetical protein [Methylobacterium sp. Leaf466]|uniref:hypothetical protein n=1 Tax=Methylobacterium sp. Leaf466 TaxID=1736386 RepID=UPI0009EB0DDC|nr:hypothetical protein [Methylobacterium sp. Leaf466]
MSITTSITSVGLLKATELIQAARTDAAIDREAGPRLVSVDIGRSVDAETREQESSRPLPASQSRVVDILV